MTASDKDLKGRVALVTGASRNIGRAIACALARDGADIAIHAARDRDAAEETARLVKNLGANAMVTLGDLADPATAGRVVEETVAKFGRLDILVNNASIRPESSFADMRYEDWRRVLGITLDAAFLLTQAALKFLEQSDQGTVINIGGLTAHTGAAHRAHVITAKAGLVGFTKALAHDLAPKKITVNCVSPGLIDTVRNKDGKAPHHHATTANLVGRRGRPEEVADTVAFLASRSARYITGETLHVNGGAYLP